MSEVCISYSYKDTLRCFAYFITSAHKHKIINKRNLYSNRNGGAKKEECDPNKCMKDCTSEVVQVKEIT